MAVAVVSGGMFFYSSVLDCPDLIARRDAELKSAQAERAAPHDKTVPACAQDRKIVTALANLRDARSTCRVNRMPPAQSSWPPAPRELNDMMFDVQQEIAKECIPADEPVSR